MTECRGWLYVWHCPCGCKSGTQFLFCDQEVPNDEYCLPQMSSHLLMLWRDVPGSHCPELLRRVKAVSKIVEQNW